MKITRRSAIVAGTVAAVAVAGALIAGPASASNTAGTASTTTNSTPPFGMMGGPGGMMGGRGGMMGGFDADGDGRPDSATVGGPRMRGRGDFGGMLGRGGMLHSEGVAAQVDSSGKTTYVTVRMQQGKVTAATDSSISITSDDGYVSTWTISSSTRLFRNGAVVKGSAFVVGDVVMAEGTVSGGTATANMVNNFAAHRFLAPSSGTTTGTTSSTNA